MSDAAESETFDIPEMDEDAWAEFVEAQLVAHLDAAQVQYSVLHGHSDLLTFTGLLATDVGGQNTDGQVHAGIAVAQSGRRNHRA